MATSETTRDREAPADGALATWWRLRLPADVVATLDASPEVLVPRSRNQLIKLSLGENGDSQFEVAYDIPGRGRVVEATVTRCRNGVAVNYTEPYMRRRDPDCMVVADEGPSEKPRFVDRFDTPFAPVRRDILAWLGEQELIVLPFVSGSPQFGYDSLLIAPKNAAFFTAALADLQGMLPGIDIEHGFTPRAIIFLAPPFRHTHCAGRQVVVHNRMADMHEIHSLNLYPGPSAKKGVYGVLLTIGESEGWITAHGSTVEVVTPYDNIVTIMHEGASGGGKSEMLEHVQRQADGRLLLGENTVTGERRYLAMGQTCALRPVTDDMALCHPDLRSGQRPPGGDGRGGRVVSARQSHRRLRRGPLLRAPVHSSARTAVVHEHGGDAGRHLPDLGAHRGRAGRAVSQSARHRAAPHGGRHRR